MVECGDDFGMGVPEETGHLAGGPVEDWEGGAGVDVEAGGAGYDGGGEGGAEVEEVFLG